MPNAFNHTAGPKAVKLANLKQIPALQQLEFCGQENQIWQFLTEGLPLNLAVYPDNLVRLSLGHKPAVDYALLMPPSQPLTGEFSTTANGFCLKVGQLCLTLFTNPVRLAIRLDGSTLLESTKDEHFRGGLRLPPFLVHLIQWV